MEAMECNNLLYIPIGDYFMIAGCKRIDLNCLASDQHYTKCIWNTVFLTVISKGDHFFLNMCD